MGLFLNPDNRAFQTAIDSEIYVDKTGLIEFTNIYQQGFGNAAGFYL